MRDEETILRARAKKISGQTSKQELQGDSLLVVEFILLPERYGIEANHVSEVLSLKELTVIPGAPSFVIGIMNVHGKIISIINLKVLFSLKGKGITELNKIMVLKRDQMEFGVIADAIHGTREVYLNTLSPPPSTVHDIGAEYIKGITPDGLILLNGEHILSNKAIIVNQK